MKPIDKRVSNLKPILIVDDQASWRELIAELLEEDFDVTFVDTFTKALAALWVQEPKFFVAVVDIRLIDRDQKDESGLSLVAELNRRGEVTNSIVITGYPTMQTAKRALKDLSAYEYILKYPEDGQGFDHKEFIRIVQNAVEDALKKRNKLSRIDEHEQIEDERIILKNNLIDKFNDSEIRDICFDLEIDYEDLAGETKQEKVIQLILFMERNSDLLTLIKTCKKKRPSLNW